MHPPGTALVELLPQQVSTPTLVVDVTDQRVLDRHAPAGGVVVVARGVERLVHLPTGVDGDQFVAQLVVRGVQGQRQRDGQLLERELADPGDQAHGGHGQPARGDPESLRGRVDDPVYGAHGGLVVGQGLPHAHEHDVGHPLGHVLRVPHHAVAQRPHTLDHLIGDLGGGEVACEAGLAGRTERAVHPAPRLGRNAHGHALVVAHEYRLDHSAVEQPVDGLDGHPLVRAQLPHGGQQRRQGLGRELAPLGGGQIRHGRGVRLEALEVVLGQLRRPERGVARVL